LNDIEKKIVESNEANAIINSRAYIQAMNLLELNLFDRFQKCDCEDIETLKEISRMQKTATNFNKIFTSLIREGDIAKAIILAEKRNVEI
jgi:hypothetical protein